METKKTPGLVKATLILGILSLVVVLLPLMSAWFWLIWWMRWVFAVPAVICGVLAITKKYDLKKVIIGLAGVVLAFILPSMMKEAYAKAAVETAKNTASAVTNYAGQYGGGNQQFNW
jgi:hypothetical protein